MPIYVTNSQPRPVKTSLLRRAARMVLRSEGAANSEVSILLTDDAKLHGYLRLSDFGHRRPRAGCTRYSQQVSHIFTS